MNSCDESWHEVMSKLLYFMYKVLPAASSHTSWTRQGVERALAWAHHCEKTLTHLKHGGSLRTALAMVARQTQHTASIQDLLRARHLLLELLLQNQLLTESVREHVLTLSQREHGAEFVCHAESAAQQQQQHAKNLLAVLTKKQYSNIYSHLKVRLMLDAASNAEPGQVGACLAKVAHSHASLQACFKAALLEEEEEGSKLGLAVVQWVQEMMTSPQHRQYRRVLGCFCSMEAHHLAQALTTHPQLVMPVLECVHREAINLEPHYDTDKCSWHPRSVVVLTWEVLVRTCAVLLSHQRMGAHVEEAVENWRMQEGGAVWGDILQQAKATRVTVMSSTNDMKTEKGKHIKPLLM